MNAPNNDPAMKRALFFMLKAALLEIRASETVHAARTFADVFHNLPIELIKCASSEDYEAAFVKLLERAARHGLEEYVRNLKNVAMQQRR